MKIMQSPSFQVSSTILTSPVITKIRASQRESTKTIELKSGDTSMKYSYPKSSKTTRTSSTGAPLRMEEKAPPTPQWETFTNGMCGMVRKNLGQIGIS